MRSLLKDRSSGVPASELERLFERVVQRGRLPMPRRQYRIGTRRVDYAYVEEGIAIELDGLAAHSGNSAFVDDRRRQNELVLGGWLILRFTWHDLTERDKEVIATIELALRTRERRANPSGR